MARTRAPGEGFVGEDEGEDDDEDEDAEAVVRASCQVMGPVNSWPGLSPWLQINPESAESIRPSLNNNPIAKSLW